MPKTKGAPTLPTSKGSITSFFNGTSKALRKVVECPVCSGKVEEEQINKHMDGPDCNLDCSEVEIIEVQGKNKKERLSASHIKVLENLEVEQDQNVLCGKLVHSEKPISKFVGKRSRSPGIELHKLKRQKRLSEDTSSRDTEKSYVPVNAENLGVLEQKLKDDSIIADLIEDNDWGEEEDNAPSSQKNILLSPSISYNPAR